MAGPVPFSCSISIIQNFQRYHIKSYIDTIRRKMTQQHHVSSQYQNQNQNSGLLTPSDSQMNVLFMRTHFPECVGVQTRCESEQASLPDLDLTSINCVLQAFELSTDTLAMSVTVGFCSPSYKHTSKRSVLQVKLDSHLQFMVSWKT